MFDKFGNLPQVVGDLANCLSADAVHLDGTEFAQGILGQLEGYTTRIFFFCAITSLTL